MNSGRSIHAATLAPGSVGVPQYKRLTGPTNRDDPIELPGEHRIGQLNRRRDRTGRPPSASVDPEREGDDAPEERGKPARSPGLVRLTEA